MRYVQGRFDQFVDQRKKLSSYERFELMHEYRSRGVDMLRGAWGHVKAQVQDREDEDRIRTNFADELPYRTGYDQMRPEELPESKKPTWVPLVAFVLMIISVFVAVAFFNVLVVFAVFLLFLSFFGFYAAYKNNGRTYTFYEGTTSNGSSTGGIMLGIFGLAGAVPLFFAGKFGVSGAMTLMMVVMFAMCGIWLIVGFIRSLSLRKRKYTEEVRANAVAYVRTVGSSHNHVSASHHGTSSKARFRTSPLFQYTYRGRNYEALYDRPCDGSNADIDLGPATIYIDPDHPEDVYHKSVSVGVKGIFSALICLALAFGMGVVFMNNISNPSPVDQLAKSTNGFNIFSFMLSSDEEREAMVESLGEDLAGSLGMEIPEEITDEMVDERIHSFVGYEDREWYYETVHIRNIYTYDSGNYSIEFDDPAFPQLGDERDVSYWHDDLLVFYVVDIEEDSEGQTHVYKMPLFYVNADEHTYVGTHGAYEG